MEVYLAGNLTVIKDYITDELLARLNMLQSFATIGQLETSFIPKVRNFLLDSGAFTYMFGAGRNKTINWEEYTDNYIEFIKQNKVDKFFELDIDRVIGYENVLKLREKVEKSVGKQCIPVWHNWRGMSEFEKMCDEYNYVAIGGLVTKGNKGLPVNILNEFARIAHRRGAKIHGLGFTKTTELHRVHWDSVDSTSWTSGIRFGTAQYFSGTRMVNIHKPSKNHRIANTYKAAFFGFSEWLKFSEYARRAL